MSKDCIANHVHTVICRGINALPENVTPATMLRAGEFPYEQMRAIALTLARDYDVTFREFEFETWVTVADVIDAVERAVAAAHREQAA